MTKAKRGRGSHRWVYLCAAASLGFALSACGGGSGATSTSAVSANLPAGASKAVTINWMPPTQNTDGTTLTNLTGYDIHYGTSSGNYTQTINVSNPGLATYVVDNLAPGTYYFTVAAVNSHGTESPLSSEVSATLN